MSEFSKLIEKLKLIEALYSGATTPGERSAAENARQRIRKKIEQHKEMDPPLEYKFSLQNMWSRKLFVALLRRYNVKPYRYYRQRHTTVMANVSKTFVDKTLWPQFLELDKELTAHINDTAEKIINEAVFGDSSEAEEIRAIAHEG
ncbi:hypothetical protein [Desulfosarcina ovata]|uniref:Uncharacterized protein n=1 Tax=Desulfosarcina ovata subsp. ovata TaxID=2752305 RepID=A0A5K8AI02_9BACT|nr:hypothetical protein [Desulfosarcina ovata]BBO92323.1 hypothetical protein DSCOOX_55030 [Desulfosarcina ovata subsp. ovata]